MLTTLKRLAFAGMFLLPIGAATAGAQTPGDTIVTSPTAEGTSIKNVASATYTDINNNAYATVKDSVSIKVGFLPAPNPTGQVSYSPGSPSVGDTAVFTLTNSGNGTDSAIVASVTPGTGVSITRYRYNGTVYADLPSLNAVIGKITLISGASLPFPIQVIYAVDGTSGGASSFLTLVQQSVRVAAKSAKWRTAILPPAKDSVTVSPDGATVAKVVSNGATDYSYSFTVTNRGNRANTFSLSAAVAGPSNGTVTISSVSPGSSGSLAPGGTATITVLYKVLNGSAPDKIIASATSAGASDVGDVTVSVSKASLAFAKTAYKTKAGVALTNTTADAVVPGDTIWYKLVVTNAAGSADANKIVMTDVLSSSLTYLTATADIPADWTISPTTSAGITTVTATLVSTVFVPAGTSRFIWIAARISTVTTPPTP
jgi:uncharacterized repeat protein (TIGR01451 family)